MGFIFALGFLAQLFFSARIIVQWFLSEKAKKVVSPSLFWIFSITGSYIFFIYGWLRHDFSIILGQFISYYIYLWNLNAKKIWNKIYIAIRAILLITPVAALSFLLKDIPAFLSTFLQNEEIPVRLVIFGSSGQIVFTLRFVYQLIYSYRRHESILPPGFWILSLTGSAMIISYGIIRLDPVLIIGQAFGFCSYIRNLIIGYNAAKKENTKTRQNEPSER